jgi:hypothetical protein
MIELLIAFVSVVLLAIASIRANNRLRHQERLPMQWSFTGKVNWTASRRIALAFTPALAALILGATAIAISASGDARPGQEGMGPPVVLMIGMVFVAVHVLHLRLIDRSLAK